MHVDTLVPGRKSPVSLFVFKNTQLTILKHSLLRLTLKLFCQFLLPNPIAIWVGIVLYFQISLAEWISLQQCAFPRSVAPLPSCSLLSVCSFVGGFDFSHVVISCLVFSQSVCSFYLWLLLSVEFFPLYFQASYFCPIGKCRNIGSNFQVEPDVSEVTLKLFSSKFSKVLQNQILENLIS